MTMMYELEKDIPLEQLIREYNAVYIAVGCHKGLKLRVPGEEDLEGVMDCAEISARCGIGSHYRRQGPIGGNRGRKRSH